MSSSWPPKAPLWLTKATLHPPLIEQTLVAHRSKHALNAASPNRPGHQTGTERPPTKDRSSCRRDLRIVVAHLTSSRPVTPSSTAVEAPVTRSFSACGHRAVRRPADRKVFPQARRMSRLAPPPYSAHRETHPSCQASARASGTPRHDRPRTARTALSG